MTRFGADFYQRFYVNRRTRVTTRAEMARRGALVSAVVKQLEIPVRRILDAGCGLGWMRGELARAFPKARYVGLEVSEHLCDRYGWVQGSLATFRPRAPFDLIICYDVMQYLSDVEAVRALNNLGRLCRGALYFHAPTIEDWRRNADRTCSDAQISLRATHWYRARLARNFRHAGCGVYVRRGVPVMQWELEKTPH
jgi:trans-aconitate methyltransferase